MAEPASPSISNIGSVPDEYICPITQEQMVKPTKIEPCLHVFDKIAIEIWNSKSKSCPLCRKEIVKLTPDQELENKIYGVASLLKPENAIAPSQEKVQTAPETPSTPFSKQADLSEEDRLYLSTLDSEDDCKPKSAALYVQYRLIGNRYFHGINIKEDRRKALYYYVKSAAGCDAEAMRMLGTYYLLGDKLLPGHFSNFQLAERYLWMACEQGDQKAIDLYSYTRGLFVKLGMEQHFGSKTIHIY